MSTQFINRQWRLPNNENKDKQSNYSMSFDGASTQYIDTNFTGLNNVSTATISAWMNIPVFTNLYALGNLQIDSGTYKGIGFNPGTSTALVYVNNNTSGAATFTFNPSSYYSAGNWFNIVFVFDGSESGTDRLKVYIDKNLVTGTWSGTPLNVLETSTSNFLIGNDGQQASPYFTGKIDAVCIFNYALSSSQVTTLYGSSSTGIGNPMSLSPKPVAMYNLGDKSAFNGANYLVPNIAAEEADGDIVTSYSPYALNFDGTNYIGLSSGISTNSSSLSIWFKTTTTYAYKGLFGLNSPFSFDYYISLLETGSNKIKFYDGSTMISLTPVINDGNWHNLVLTYNHSSSSFKAYTDGSETYSGSYSQPSGMVLQYIGSTYAVNRKWVGDLSNASLWNAALTSAQVTEIYNEGVPSNLNNHSAYSNLVGWWQLGSNSSFNTNWTVLDEKGSINGISVNMTEDDIVDGVGSYANGTSSGMGGDEVIGDAPYSTANALSVNMDVADRVEDTPS